MNATTSTRTHSLGQRSIVLAAILALLSWSFLVVSPAGSDASEHHTDGVPDGYIEMWVEFVHTVTGERRDHHVWAVSPGDNVNDAYQGSPTRVEPPAWYIEDFTVDKLHLSCSDEIWNNEVEVNGQVGFDTDGTSDFGDWLVAPMDDGQAALRIVNDSGNRQTKACGPADFPEPDVQLDKDNQPASQTEWDDPSDAEPGENVEFRLRITNTSDYDVVITELTDEIEGRTYNLLSSDAPDELIANDCVDLDGETLTPGQQVTCTFEVSGYAPGADSSLTNTAEVTVGLAAVPHRQASDDDTSVVNTPPEEPPTITVDLLKENRPETADDWDDEHNFAQTEAEDVDFRLTITNTSEHTIVVTDLMDEVEDTGATIDLLAGTATGAVVTMNTCADLTEAERTLDPDESVDCELTVEGYAPPAGEELDNTATVTAEIVPEDEAVESATASDDSTVETRPEPGAVTVNLTKTNDADGDGVFTDSEMAPEEGADVPFEVTISNPSADVTIVVEELTDTVEDVFINLLEGTTDGATLLANQCATLTLAELTLGPNESVTCQFEVQGYAPEPGESLTNTAGVKAHDVDDESRTATAEDQSTVTTPDPEPGDMAVSLTKTNDADGDGTFTDEEEAPEPGADVPFHVEIENTGEVDVTITSLIDEFDGVVVDLLEGEVTAGEASIVENDCDELADTTIAVGGTVECNFTLGDYAPDWGESLVDTVTVDVEDEDGREDTADDDSTVTTEDEPVEPVGIVADITKTNDADGDGEFSEEEFAENEGDAVDFQLEVFNDNAVDVVIVELTDSYDGIVIDLLAGDVLEGEATLTNNTCSDLETIPANDSVTCTFTLEGYAPAEGEDVTNVAFVELQDPETGETADADDTSLVETVEEGVLPEELEPGISLVKEADVTEAEVGDVITYTYTVTNTGDTTLTDITLDDDVLGEITLESTTLEPGESTTGTATHTVTEEDLEAGEVVNVAIVTGWPPEGDPVTDEDDETVQIVVEDVEEAVLAEELPVTGFDALQALFAALLALSLGGVTLLGLRLHELRGRMYGTA